MDIYYTYNGEAYTWDEEKARNNRRKHGISFEEACEVFFDPFYQTGDASDNNEEREFIIGFSMQRRLLIVIYVERGAKTRIISARRTTNHERKAYEEA